MGKINVRDRNKNTDKSPNWEYRFESAKVDGKRKQISKSGFKTKKEALEAGTKALAEYNKKGYVFTDNNISLKDYLDFYFENYVKINLRHNTQINTLSAFKLITQTLGMYKLSALTPAVLQKFVNSLKTKYYTKKTVEKYISNLSAALDYAVEPLQYLEHNPMRHVKKPKFDNEKKEKTIVTPGEFKKIIDTVTPKSHCYIPMMISYYTGARVSEVLALTWEDIDLNKKEININKQIIYRKLSIKPQDEHEPYNFYFQSLKSASSERTVKIGAILCDVLKEAKLSQKKNELKYGEYYTVYKKETPKDENNNILKRIVPVKKSEEKTTNRINLVCIAENGKVVHSYNIAYLIRRINKDLNLDFNMHSLRHAHATMLIESGISPKTVQKRLGHANITTTLQTYVHNTEAMEDNAVDVFDKITSMN